MQAREAGFSEPDLAVQLVDCILRLRYQVFLRRDLRVEGLDDGDDRVDMPFRGDDSTHHGLQLLLARHLLPDALVVRDEGSVPFRRFATAALARYRRLQQQWYPMQHHVAAPDH